MRLSSNAFQEVTWREGTDRKLRSRFAAVRVRPAHRDYEKAEPHAEEWLLITIMDALGGSSLIQSA
jgi:SRSO17 transposase